MAVNNNANLIIIILSLILIILSGFAISLSLYHDFSKQFTGEASREMSGYINITLTSVISITLTRNNINWSEGAIDYGELNATLFTSGNNNGTVIRGNWSGVNVTGFIIENTGNVNCSIYVNSGKTAHQFFNSQSSSNEEYQFNVTNAEPESCMSGQLGTWIDANITSYGTLYCDSLNFRDEKDSLYIDVLFTVPADSVNIGEQYDTVTVIGNAAL